MKRILFAFMMAVLLTAFTCPAQACADDLGQTIEVVDHQDQVRTMGISETLVAQSDAPEPPEYDDHIEPITDAIDHAQDIPKKGDGTASWLTWIFGAVGIGLGWVLKILKDKNAPPNN